MNHNKQAIGILGGTFDPIHFGHLRSAVEIFDHFKLSEMRLIPCKSPPHRSTPIASANDRLHMVQLGISGSELWVDEREMQREGPSYSVDTLTSLRHEYPNASLCMVIGQDAFLSLTTWHQWEKLLQLANIIVTCRTGWIAPSTGILGDLLKRNTLDPHESLTHFASGYIQQHFITSLDISASKIRSLLHSGQSARFLLPEKVYDYIQQKNLYRNLTLTNSQEAMR